MNYHGLSVTAKSLFVVLAILSVSYVLAVTWPSSDAVLLFGGGTFVGGAAGMAKSCGWAAHNFRNCSVDSIQTVLGAVITAVALTGAFEGKFRRDVQDMDVNALNTTG